MSAETTPFAYALLRVIPCAQRGESLNAGVVLFCRQLGFLELRIELDGAKLSMIAPGADRDAIDRRLDEIRKVISGDPAGGSLSSMHRSERFGWLVAPSSTVIQASEVHTGLTGDPAAELDRLFETLVR